MTERQSAMLICLCAMAMVLAMPGVYRHAPVWFFAAYMLAAALTVGWCVWQLALRQKRVANRCPCCAGAVDLIAHDDARCADCGAGLRVDLRPYFRWGGLQALSAWLAMLSLVLGKGWLLALGAAGVLAAVVGAALDRSCKWRAR